MNQFNITAVIVTYFPDSQVVAKTIGSICGQVYKVYVIDNTPGGSEVFKNGNLLDKSNIELITLGENVGIARAQNIGIQKAIEDGADFIWLSDQDTFYPDTYVDRMIEVYSHRSDKDSIATIVPDFVVPKGGGEHGGFIEFEENVMKVIRPESGCHEIAQAIASGMIIPSSVFATVGFMREDLFIDAVDSEWSWRARAKGYKILGCADIVIQHQLGERMVRWWRYSHDVRAPIRDYYIIRNGIYLALRSEYLSSGMKHYFLKLYLKYIVYCIFFGTPHWKHFWYSFKGLYHGLTGQLGPYK
jgi:rhamnosyltransferase